MFFKKKGATAFLTNNFKNTNKGHNYYPIEMDWDRWAKDHQDIVNEERKVILRNGQSPG